MSRVRGPDLRAAFAKYQPSKSVIKLLVEALRKNGDALAMVEGDTGRSVSFADLLRQSLRIAAGLRGAGVAAQDYVVICCDKSILSLAFLLGTMFTGATAVVAPTTHADRIHYVTKGHTIKGVFFDPKYRESVLQMSVPFMEPAPLLTAVLDQDDQTMTSIFDRFEDLDVFEATDVNTHVPLILFSSGTTGEPKATKISDIGIQLPGISFPAVHSILSAAPLFWYSSVVFLSASILQNFTLILTNSRDTAETLKLIQTYKIHALFVGSASLVKFAHEPSLHLFDVSSVKRVIIGGDIVLSTVAESFVNTVFKGYMKLESIYGSTEAGMLTKCQNMEGLGHNGYPLPGVKIKVVDDDGSVVPIGQVGYVMSRSPGLTPGYWGNTPSITLDHEGFFPLEDMGFMDKRGHLHVKSRIVDMIVYRGIRVSPWDIEDVLLTHPGVANAAVVGRPHPSDGQRPVAYVVRRAGSDVTEDQLVTFVDGKVEDATKLRGGVIFIDTFPFTIIGKINRKILRDNFA